jgi:hypothetical protein
MNQNLPLELDIPCTLLQDYLSVILACPESFLAFRTIQKDSRQAGMTKETKINSFLKNCHCEKRSKIGGEAEANTEIPFMTEIGSASLHLFYMLRLLWQTLSASGGLAMTEQNYHAQL